LGSRLPIKEEVYKMECPKCGSTNNKLVRSGPHKKLICGNCYTYIKFVSKSEAKNFELLEAESGAVKEKGGRRGGKDS